MNSTEIPNLDRLCGDESAPATRTVSVGDWVSFKSDTEQSGRIVEIRPGRYWAGVELVLENPDGFRGDYIGGDRQTVLAASDCWT